MKKALILPLLATCCLGFSSCIFQQQQQCGPTEREWNRSLTVNKQRVKDLQQAARECTSMKWEGEVSVYNEATHSFVQQTYTYPVSDEDAATIRALLANLHAVKTNITERLPVLGSPCMHCTLHLLDAEGKIINLVTHSEIGADSRTDENGCLNNLHFSLPDADYAAWQKLIPADLQRRYDKAATRWKRGNK